MTSPAISSRPMTGQATAATVVDIRHLRKSFQERVVLKDMNLTLHDGENLVILGRSGTGKSVLIKCMVGLIRPDGGDINVLGYHVPTLTSAQLIELRLQVGFSFQGSALYDSMTVKENLEFPLKRNLGITNRDELLQRVSAALEDVGLLDAMDQMPAELSGGMKKRIGIARTLILRPRVMLYDEPTAGLDPITSREINILIREVQQKYNTSAIIITHDITCARETGDRIVAMIGGVNALEGSFEELRHSRHPEMEAFFNY